MSAVRLRIDPADAERLAGLLSCIDSEIACGRLGDLFESATGSRDAAWLDRVRDSLREARVAQKVRS